MATLAYGGRFGVKAGETPQTVNVGEGYKTVFLHETFVDTDSVYDDTTATWTIPQTGVYYINWQARGGTGPGTRILKDGTTVLATGINPNSTGSDKGSATAVFFGCLEAGSTLNMQGAANSITSGEYSGYLQLLRVPTPKYSIAVIDPPGAPAEYNTTIRWQTVCNQPSWLDAAHPTRATVAETGFYFLTAKTTQNTGSKWRKMKVYVNGFYINQQAACPGPAVNIPLTTVLQLTAGDYVELYNDTDPGSTVEGFATGEWEMFKIPGPVHGAHAYLASKAVSASFTDVALNTSIFDTDGYWTTSGQSRMTIPTGRGGNYLVWAGYAHNAQRAINYQIIASGSHIRTQVSASGIDSIAAHNWTSPVSAAVWDLAAGDIVVFEVQNGDGGSDTAGGFNAVDLHFGLVQLDGWTYQRVSGCPCPTVFVPQVYRVKRP